MAPVAVLFLVLLGQADGKAFLATQEVDSDYIKLVVQGALHGVLGSGHGVKQERVMKINATLTPLFNALPKNQWGRLNSPSMRYAVQRYFSQQHGWVVKGFEPHAANATEDSDVHAGHIVYGKIPGYVESVLKDTLSSGGFALQDIVILVTAIEKLIFDENLKTVESAYRLNGMSTVVPFYDAASLAKLLTSYFIIEHLNGDASSVEQHKVDKASIRNFYPHWNASRHFMSDIVGDDAHARHHLMNPFALSPFTFEDVARITSKITEGFGPFSNHECHEMKLAIAEQDVYNTGRVRLADFYRVALSGGPYQFFETADYLKLLGALDSSSPSLGPQVIIPNYLIGINNCISTSAHYDICCLNECDAIYQHLETHLKRPSASATEIQAAIEGGITLSPLLSSTAPTEPRNLTAPLLERLSQIARTHEGQIPLHGRLFAQWLHYVFPRECPFPHKSGTVSRQTMNSVKESRTLERTTVTDEEILQHLKSELRAPSPNAGLGMWSTDEELLAPMQLPSSLMSRLLRSAVFLLVLVSFAAVLMKESSRIVHLRGNDKQQLDAGKSYNV